MKGAIQDFIDDTMHSGYALYSGVWYSFLETGKKFILDLKTAETASNLLGEITVFQGTCDHLECFAQEESDGEDAFVNASVPSTAGAQYKVLIAYLELPTYDVYFQ